MEARCAFLTKAKTYTLPFKTFHWLSISLRVKAEGLTMTFRALYYNLLPILLPLCCPPPSSPTVFLLTHSVIRGHTDLEYGRYATISGPLHVLIPLPGMAFPPMNSISLSHLQVFARLLPFLLGLF